LSLSPFLSAVSDGTGVRFLFGLSFPMDRDLECFMPPRCPVGRPLFQEIELFSCRQEVPPLLTLSPPPKQDGRRPPFFPPLTWFWPTPSSSPDFLGQKPFFHFPGVTLRLLGKLLANFFFFFKMCLNNVRSPNLLAPYIKLFPERGI